MGYRSYNYKYKKSSKPSWKKKNSWKTKKRVYPKKKRSYPKRKAQKSSMQRHFQTPLALARQNFWKGYKDVQLKKAKEVNAMIAKIQ